MINELTSLEVSVQLHKGVAAGRIAIPDAVQTPIRRQ
tara:strand:+ start:12179 stop:12289 length:111 start_codon:yes stop_codon:yes gene_type:complete